MILFKLGSYILATNKFFLNNSTFSQLYEIKLHEMIEQLDPQLLVTVSGRLGSSPQKAVQKLLNFQLRFNSGVVRSRDVAQYVSVPRQAGSRDEVILSPSIKCNVAVETSSFRSLSFLGSFLFFGLCDCFRCCCRRLRD